MIGESLDTSKEQGLQIKHYVRSFYDYTRITKKCAI